MGTILLDGGLKGEDGVGEVAFAEELHPFAVAKKKTRQGEGIKLIWENDKLHPPSTQSIKT